MRKRGVPVPDPNFVTPSGARAARAELEQLSRTAGDPDRIRELTEHLATAQEVAPADRNVVGLGAAVTIEDEDGPIFLNLRIDNKTLEETLANQTVLKTKAQWRTNELVVERAHETDGSARMVMRIDPKTPKLLVIDFHYEHKRQRRTIDQRRIYEAGV